MAIDKIAIRQLKFSLYIGDLPWEKTHLQTVSVDVEINLKKGKPPDYWKISKGILDEFSKSHYEWVEDLVVSMVKYLKNRFKIKGRLIVKKFPRVPRSPKIFEVEAVF